MRCFHLCSTLTEIISYFPECKRSDIQPTNKTSLFLTSLEAGSLLAALADLVSGENTLSGSVTASLFSVPSSGRRGKRLWGLFHEGANSIHEDFISQRPCFLMVSYWS